MADKTLVPMAVKRELRKLGSRIKQARLARNLTMQLVAERAMTTRQTVSRIEAGDPSVSFGTVLAVLNALGLLSSVDGVADPKEDVVAQQLQRESHEKRRARPRDPASSTRT
ncbi:helix-turn-helix transcriptional regulator [Aidingimonas lacisalsi]|uniref:helix-turn-helix transcriptional regulator n=1 Tax=Aidingimonas lacisalsi TaxID=2604086 RepID=UPI0011D19B88|nr:helix-turn-helix transcriptional regulator [Aidingimonas lacisalsi]